MNGRPATPTADWEQRVAALWGSFDAMSETDFHAALDRLLAELPPDSAIACFERGCAQDSTGHSDLAVPLYEQALAKGLDGIRRRRAVIQMSSSLRNLGRADDGVRLLRAEREQDSDMLDDAVAATLALCLVDSGHAREAVSVAVAALATHLPRYQRSMGNYARALMDEDRPG